MGYKSARTCQAQLDCIYCVSSQLTSARAVFHTGVFRSAIHSCVFNCLYCHTRYCNAADTDAMQWCRVNLFGKHKTCLAIMSFTHRFTAISNGIIFGTCNEIRNGYIEMFFSVSARPLSNEIMEKVYNDCSCSVSAFGREIGRIAERRNME